MSENAALDKVDGLIEQLESPDLSQVARAVFELRELVGDINDKDTVQRILDTVKRERPKWGGPSNLGDNAVLLRYACEEKVTELKLLTNCLSNWMREICMW
jgi:hypothetical protein